MEFRTLTKRVAESLKVAAPALAEGSPRAGRRTTPPAIRRVTAALRPRPLRMRSATLPRSTAGSPRSASAAMSPSTPKPPASTRCAPTWSASRSASRPGEAAYIPLGHTHGRRRPVRLDRPGRGPDAAGRGAGAAQAGAGGRRDPQDRPEHEVRREDLRPPRHPRRPDRRHDADVLRDARRPARPRHGRAVRALPRPHPDPDQGPARQRQDRRSPSTACPSTRR